jgi:trehalose-phosphatase
MHLAQELQKLAAHYRTGGRLALFFDFDGTLAPLVTHPDLATCPPAMHNVLAALARVPRVTAGIVSGRMLSDLKAKINLPSLYYAGTCGLELELGDRPVQHPDAGRYLPALGAAGEEVASLVQGYSGAWIEYKPLAFTVHYRQVRPGEIAVFKQSLGHRLMRFDGVLVSTDSSMAVEVLPDIRWGKGEALQTIIQHACTDALPLYAGNDANDAGAMRVAVKRGGVAIGVGPTAPDDAVHRVPDVQCLTLALDHLLSQLQAGPTQAL